MLLFPLVVSLTLLTKWQECCLIHAKPLPLRNVLFWNNVLLKLKYFLRLQAFAYAFIVVLSQKRCKIENLLVCYYRVQTTNKGKGFPYSLPSVGPRADPGIQAVSPQVTISHPPGGRLPLLSTRPAVTFPATALPPLSIRLYCLVTEAQLAQGCYAAFAPSRIWTHDLLIASPTLYPLRHRATYRPLIGSDIWRIK